MKLFTAENYEIELSQIHSFEDEHYYKKEFKLEKELYKDIRSKMEHIYLVHSDPFVIKSDCDEVYWKSKMQELKHGLESENPFISDLIYVKNKFYTFDSLVEVNREIENYNLWFALKLRQFNYELFKIDGFLDYVLKKDFNQLRSDFKKFLKITIRQYSKNLFSKELIETVNEWLAETEEILAIEKTKSKISPKTTSGRFLSYDLDETIKKNKQIDWTKLKNDLVEKKFITKDNKARQLKDIFHNINIQKDQRVNWCGANIELKWFLEYLIKQNGIVQDPKNEIWNLATKCFVKSNGDDYSIEQLSKANGKRGVRSIELANILQETFAKP